MENHIRFEEIISIKESTLNKINDLLKLITEINNSIETKPFNGNLENLEQISVKLKSETFKAIVVGEFSTGKSTFINALLGKDILPTDDNETTAVINIIRYGIEPEMILQYWGDKNENGIEVSEGKFEKVKLDKIIDHTTSLTELSNSNSQKIKYAILNYPSELCQDDIEIIDTPGLNSVIGYHEETTLNYLNNGHCAIMLLKATQLFTKVELDYLNKFKRHLNKIFFVVNKIDLLRSDFYSEDSKRSRRRKLNKELNISEDLKYYLVSSIKATDGQRTDSGIDTFIEDFKSFLASGEKPKEMIFPAVIQSLQIIASVKANLITLEKGLSFSPVDFDRKVNELSPKMNLIKERITDLNSFIDMKSQNILNKYVILNKESRKSFLSNIKSYILNYNGEPQDLKREIESKVRVTLTNYYQDINDEILGEITDLSKEVKRRFEDYLSLINEYQFSISTIMQSNENIYTLEKNILLNPDQDFSLMFKQVGGGFGIGVVLSSLLAGPIGLIASVFGGLVFAGYLREKHIQQMLKDLSIKVINNIDKHFDSTLPGRKKAIANNLDQIKNTLKRDMEQSVDSINKTIESVRIEKKNSFDKVENRKNELNKYLKQLIEMEDHLVKLKLKLGGAVE